MSMTQLVEPVNTADQIVPPVAVALIDQYLLNLPAAVHLVSSRVIADLLLDIRNAIWVPTELSMAVHGVLATKADDSRRQTGATP